LVRSKLPAPNSEETMKSFKVMLLLYSTVYDTAKLVFIIMYTEKVFCYFVRLFNLLEVTCGLMLDAMSVLIIVQNSSQ